LDTADAHGNIKGNKLKLFYDLLFYLGVGYMNLMVKNCLKEYVSFFSGKITGQLTAQVKIDLENVGFPEGLNLVTVLRKWSK
jgi:hypothetical protein